ncbi:MAG: hypothetical protein J6N76_02470 [Lachnospiraceae bacterium]|nr:hypothetical protein [Lachnospiraceae bacterium]
MIQDNIKNLEQMRSLVLGNMPRTVVHTKRAPLPEELKAAALAIIAEKPEESMLSRAAVSFKDAEDDKAASAAMALLYEEALAHSEDELCREMISRIDEYAPRLRSVYLEELKKRTGDDRYDELIRFKRFKEGAARGKGDTPALVVRYIESLTALKDDLIYDEGAGDGVLNFNDTAHWITLTSKKLMEVCERYIKKQGNNIKGTNAKNAGKNKASAMELAHISAIYDRAKLEKEALDKVIDRYKDDPEAAAGITWGEALTKEKNR